LYVIDVQTNKLVKAIHGAPGVTGLEYVPGLRKVYTSDWGEEELCALMFAATAGRRPDSPAKTPGLTDVLGEGSVSDACAAH